MDTDAYALLAAAGAAVSAFATVVLAILTGRYVRLTNRMLEEARAARAPQVFADLDFDWQLVRLVVGNRGPGDVHNIRLEVREVGVKWREEKSRTAGFHDLAPVAKGISHLAPGRQLRYTVGFLDWKGMPSPGKIEFRLTYDDAGERGRTREFVIDLASYERALLDSFNKPEAVIARAIQDAVRELASKQRRDLLVELSTKACPSCAERIPRAAKKCSRCHELIPEEGSPDEPNS